MRYHFTDSISVDIRQLRGKLVPTQGIPVFDDVHSFALQLDSATLAVSTDALGHVLNDYVFADKDAPLKDLSISTNGNQLRVKGKLAQKGGVTFETVGTIEPTPDGKIRLHADHIKAAHLPLKGLMDIFGVKLADLINTRKVKGVFVEKDDILLDPQEIFPPPRIRGNLTGITLENGQIVQTYGSTAQQPERPGEPRNFMAYHGGTLKFGKLTMSDTDLTLIDANPKDAFDFYLDHYREQLAAGYTKTTPELGLRVYMVDYNKLSHGGSGDRRGRATGRSAKAVASGAYPSAPIE